MQDIKKDFPILQKKINGKRFVYLNSAATSQKPEAVIETMKDYYENYNSNLNRGSDSISIRVSKEYEAVREKVARFINADKDEIVFTKSATESINLVMYSVFQEFSKGDEIILSIAEHHSNLVPWQHVQKKDVKLKFVDVDENGVLRIDQFKKLLNEKTKLVCLMHVSNVLGTINSIKEICKLVHNVGARVLIDAAQSVPNMKVDVKEIGCDFLVFSGHKMLSPMGIGVLYGKKNELEKLNPFLYGGDMISEVELENSSWAEVPRKFEAGTQNISAVVGFGKAIDYLNKVGMETIRNHEKDLVKYTLEKLNKIKGIKIYGPKNLEIRGGVVSFNVSGIHPHDVAEFLASKGIAVRAGHMCCQPLMKRLGVSSVVRVSFYIYNTKEDVDLLCNALEEAIKFFNKRK